MLNKIQRKIARSITTSPFKLRADQAIVSFTFDDFPASAAAAGSKLLLNAGMNGTYYLSGNYVGKELDNNQIASAEMIKELMDSGHEIGCHTFGHINCQNSDEKFLYEDLHKNQKIIRSLIEQDPVSFAYPYGNMDISTKFKVMRIYRTARGIDPGLNYGWSDLANLKANAIYSNSYSRDSVATLLSAALKKNAWLIFYSHDISNNPEKFGCSPEQLKEIIEMVEKSDALVLPIKHALAHYAFYKQGN